jgi:hypothetical protein
VSSAKSRCEIPSALRHTYNSFKFPFCTVRDVISPQLDLWIGTGSPDRPDPSRALIGGACRSWQCAPPRAAPYKRGASRGTGTNVHRAHCATTNSNPKTDQRGAEARGLTPPRLRTDRRSTHSDLNRTPAPPRLRTDDLDTTMSSSSSPQGKP